MPGDSTLSALSLSATVCVRDLPCSVGAIGAEVKVAVGRTERSQVEARYPASMRRVQRVEERAAKRLGHARRSALAQVTSQRVDASA